MNRIQMSPSRRTRLVVFLSMMSFMLVASATARAQDVKATVQVEAAGSPAMSMEYWMGAESVRIDMAQGQAVSIVWTSGASPTMLMIQHAERSYMEWGDQQFQMMRQMMQRLPGAGGGGDTPEVNVDDIRFEPTGETETIGPWSASGVRMTGMEAGQDGTFWIASELDTGLFELFARMGDALEAMQMPMLGGGLGGAQSQLTRYTEMKNVAGLPDGGVVRVNANDPNGATTITLQSIDVGPFGDNPFAPPAGYEKMQMPSFPE